MKYLFATLLLSISPVIMADLQMNDQLEGLRASHEQQMQQWQQDQQSETRIYLQQQQEQQQRQPERRNNIAHYYELPSKRRSPINRSDAVKAR